MPMKTKLAPLFSYFRPDLLLGLWNKSCRTEHTVFEVGTNHHVLAQQMVPLQETATIFVLNRSQKPSPLPPHSSTTVSKVQGTVFFSPLGAWKFGRDHFVSLCCISPFLMQCACTLENQWQMHLRYEDLWCWGLQQTSKPILAICEGNIDFSMSEQLQTLQSHWVTLQVILFSFGGNDTRCPNHLVINSFVSSFYKMWLSQHHGVRLGLQGWAVTVGGY